MKLLSIPSCMLAAGLLAGCAGDYTFNSNLSGKAVNEYFKAGDVALIEKNVAPPRPFNPLAMVDGESCQIFADEPPASAVDARTKMRLAAADAGGNGVMLNNCVEYKDPEGGCLSRVICIGRAIVMEDE
ncbi:hypothetical protein L2725_04290 [Shewanella corallii]|uniref:Lipoprotein n=2 Tax=Shewanella TaxID=22 RepID=A0ABT0N3I3_9GAMM|nr:MULTISPECIES: Rcs stress response system protein RcsF [Shewanella]MCL1036395.1 hypothetical protein [Shewanella submarina]MCL2913004.1 hypothetical protein [Shewanella corallii]